MAAFFSNLRNTVIAGFVLALIVFIVHFEMQGGSLTIVFWLYLVRWLHVIAGVMWIGLLWYFNFVSTPTTPQIPAELRPALGKYITPAALFWFRWAAMATILLGLLLAQLNGYMPQALTLDAYDPVGSFTDEKSMIIGIGMWFGIIMWFNVWFVIWPNQQKALNIANKYPDLSADDKAASAKTAGMLSRINTMLSIPMLFAMVAAQNIY